MLSEKRTLTVKKHLLSKGIDDKILKTNSFGENKPIESNESEDGKQKNRRVDITIHYKPKVEVKPILIDTIPKQHTQVDTCESLDTIIILKQGTQIIFNRCEYLQIKDCLEYNETNNSSSIVSNGLSLMDSSGVVLASCGMIKISIKPDCPNIKLFKKPIKILFPVPENNDCDYCKKNARTYVYQNKSQWIALDKKKHGVKIVKKENKSFYQLETNSPNIRINCDCPVEKGNKIKFKTKHNYKIINLKITSDCPTLVAEVTPLKPKNRINVNFPCSKGNKTVLATIINNKGDTLILKEQPLNDLPKKIMFSHCPRVGKNKIGNFLWFFPISQKESYRKYYIKSKMLVKQ